VVAVAAVEPEEVFPMVELVDQAVVEMEGHLQVLMEQLIQAVVVQDFMEMHHVTVDLEDQAW
jgi:hypothetical protein